MPARLGAGRMAENVALNDDTDVKCPVCKQRVRAFDVSGDLSLELNPDDPGHAQLWLDNPVMIAQPCGHTYHPGDEPNSEQS